MATPPFRIAAGQPVATKAKQAPMIACQQLQLLTFRQPYHMGFHDQRRDLLHTLATEFGRTAVLPPMEASAKLVLYLVVVDERVVDGKKTTVRQPLLIPEVEVLPWVFGYVLAKAGREAAERVSYRPEILTQVIEK